MPNAFDSYLRAKQNAFAQGAQMRQMDLAERKMDLAMRSSKEPGFTLSPGQVRFGAGGEQIASGGPVTKPIEPSFSEKEAIKGKQKRLNALQESRASRQSSLGKAKKFLQLFETGQMESGAGRKAAGFIPGVWTAQGQLDEEFNAFAEIAARQALKASGEIRPTDADVKGMKEAMFGVGRDEETNKQLLRNYIAQQEKDEGEYQVLKPGRAASGAQKQLEGIGSQPTGGWSIKPL